MFNHIVVPLDYAFVPRATLMTAVLLAVEQGAQLTLLYVSDLRSDASSALPAAASSDGEVRYYNGRIIRSINDAWAIVSEFGAKADMHVAGGRPIHKVIKSAAESMNADLIIMGTHGRRGLAHALWGSVTEEVLRESDIPVLVVREAPIITPDFSSHDRRAG